MADLRAEAEAAARQWFDCVFGLTARPPEQGDLRDIIHAALVRAHAAGRAGGLREKSTKMKAGYAGGRCEGCNALIAIGDIYYFMPDDRATVLCESCRAEAKSNAKPKESPDA